VDKSLTGWGTQLDIHSSDIYEINVQYLENNVCYFVGNNARRRDIQQDVVPLIVIASDSAQVQIAFDTSLLIQYSTSSTPSVMNAISNVTDDMTIVAINSNISISLPAGLNLTAGCFLNVSIGLVPVTPNVSNAILTYSYNISSKTPGIHLASPFVGDFWALFESSCPQNFTIATTLQGQVYTVPNPNSAKQLWSSKIFVISIFVAVLLMM